ncbi:MAG: hypothetical protein Q8O93_03620 [bacterium]|nr:hypothetical protein [bacterium]
MKKIIKKILFFISENLGLGDIKREIRDNNKFQQANFLRDNLYENAKYLGNKRLTRYERKVFSQGGEDGIIEEIFKRIGVTDKIFMEFGIGDGTENNSLNLLANGWSGRWLEGNSASIDKINADYGFLLKSGRLKVKNLFITAENIEQAFREMAMPKEFDLLSIDIDGNDYWVWRAIKNYSPRAVVIEYNGNFGPETKWVMKYNPNHNWRGNSYFGASLKSLELLGAEKGYKLVGCNFAGANAFFVRQDLAGENFFSPFTSENHYEPKRPFLLKTSGDKRYFGEFVNI